MLLKKLRKKDIITHSIINILNKNPVFVMNTGFSVFKNSTNNSLLLFYQSVC